MGDSLDCDCRGCPSCRGHHVDLDSGDKGECPCAERVRIDGVALSYQEVGNGIPILFENEFAGEAASWRPQVRFFGRRYRTVTFNARGYPPWDVPEDPAAYSQIQAAEDIRAVLDHLKIDKAHVVGLSMGGYATLHFGLRYPERALSLVVAGAGYGSTLEEREAFRRDCAAVADRIDREGLERVAETVRPRARAGPIHGQGPDRLDGVSRFVAAAVGDRACAHDARRADDAAVDLRTWRCDDRGSWYPRSS